MEKCQSDRWKDEIVRVLETFISICEQNDLSYFIAYGTAIGAVRHNGFIPWDDDVDVMMPRSDYNKFIDLLKEDVDNCRLLRPLPYNYYYLPFAKLISTRTNLLEKRTLRCVLGAFVDIFPLDYLPDDIPTAEKIIRKFHKKLRCLLFLSSYYSILDIQLLWRNKNYKEIIYAIYFSPFKRMRRRLLLHELSSLEKETIQYENSNFVGYLGGDYMGRGDMFPKSWFEGYSLVKFEKIFVRLCKGYDAYLFQIYNDYMKLPPVENRVSWHDVEYKSFETLMTYKELKKKIAHNK